MEFSSLQLDVQLQILSFLTHDELRLKFAPVSEQCRLLSQHPFLRKHLLIENQTPQDTVILLKTFSRIRELQMSSTTSWSWISAMPILNYLRNLTITHCHFQSCATISQLVAHVPNIHELRISGCLNKTGRCTSQIPTCKFLKKIYIRVKYCVNGNCRNFDGFLKNFTTLEEINIDCYQLTDSSLLKATKNVYTHTSLKKLKVDGNKLTDGSYKSLSKFHQLVHLSVKNAYNLTNVGLNGIKELTNLQCLKIFYCDENFIQFFTEALFYKLTVLKLSSLNLHDRAVALMVMSCPRLLELHLTISKYVTDGSLSTVVEKCSRLEVMSLHLLIRINGSFMENIPMKLPHLTKLSLRDCFSIIPRKYQVLKHQKPCIRIFDKENNEVPDVRTCTW